jgi:hypothetical protein
MSPILASNLHTFKHFLHLSQPGRVAQMDPVTGLPRPQNSPPTGSFQRSVELSIDSKIKPDAVREGRRLHLPGNNTFVLFGFQIPIVRKAVWTAQEPNLAVGSVGAETLCQFQFLASLARLRQGTQRFGCCEVRSGFNLRGSITKQTALHGNRLGQKPHKIKGNAFGGSGRAPSSADGPPAKKHLLGYPSNLALPPDLFIASQFGHLGQMIAQLWIPGRKLRQQFVTNAIAREREMAIRGVFPPRLFPCIKKRLDFGARALKQRTNDWAGILPAFELRMNS